MMDLTWAASATAPASTSGRVPSIQPAVGRGATNDGRVKIKSNLAGKLLDPGMATENGTVLQIWADVNGDNQFWTINEVTRKPKTSAKLPPLKQRLK